jgi:hypothetical protein
MTTDAFDQPLLIVEGRNTSFAVFEDRIMIRGAGVVKKLLQNAPAVDLTIPIAHMSAIQFKSCGFFSGSIRFLFAGATIFDQFLITFNKAQQPAVEHAKATIEGLMRHARR